MNAEEAAKLAVSKVREIMSKANGSEQEVLEAFIDELDAELEGLNIRLEELEETED